MNLKPNATLTICNTPTSASYSLEADRVIKDGEDFLVYFTDEFIVDYMLREGDVLHCEDYRFKIVESDESISAHIARWSNR